MIYKCVEGTELIPNPAHPQEILKHLQPWGL